MGHWEYTQSPALFNTTSIPSLHHIITTNPNPWLNPPITIAWVSRHVNSFFNICIGLLADISVTVATSHWLRSPLKAEASENTIARKEGRLHSQLTRKKRRRKNSYQSTATAQRRQTFFKLHTSPLHQPKPRMNLLQSQSHVQVKLRHPQTYVSTWCNTCW